LRVAVLFVRRTHWHIGAARADAIGIAVLRPPGSSGQRSRDIEVEAIALGQAGV